jgi:DNA-binding NarL/FixJ family response regulator
MRILVADDQELVRRRVCSTFASRPDFEVCGEASSGQEAIDKAKALQPDLVILDITMPVMNGLDAARMIRECCPAAHILIFSVHRSKHLLHEAQKIGVEGYVTKGEPPQNLLAAADAVLANQTFFPSDL